MLSKLRRFIQPILDSPNADTRRPVIDANFESNISGLYVIGDLGGAPVVKLAMAQGSQVADHIAAKPDARTAAASGVPNRYDLIVVGAGAAGLNAALGTQARGLRVAVIEKNKIANTIEDFPEGKWIYAEPESVPAAGKLWLEGASKEDLLERWRKTVEQSRLDVRTGEGLVGLKKVKGGFEVSTNQATYHTARVVLATGVRGNARELHVPGEE